MLKILKNEKKSHIFPCRKFFLCIFVKNMSYAYKFYR